MALTLEQLALRRTGFEARTIPEPNTGCLLWTGTLTRDGYGRIMVDHRPVRAHRVALALSGVRVPAGASVLHRCDLRVCVNPAHLYVGTPQQNMVDRDQRGRQARGERHGIARLTSKQVVKIRAAWADGATTTALAKRFRISRSQAYRIATRAAWVHEGVKSC